MRVGRISYGLLPVLALLPLASFLRVHLVVGVVDGGDVVDGVVVVLFGVVTGSGGVH